MAAPGENRYYYLIKTEPMSRRVRVKLLLLQLVLLHNLLIHFQQDSSNTTLQCLMRCLSLVHGQLLKVMLYLRGFLNYIENNQQVTNLTSFTS